VNSDLMRALLDVSGEGLLALDEHGAILEANEPAARLLGRLRTHLLGKPFATLVALDDRRRFRQAFGTAAQTPLRVEAELRLHGQSERMTVVLEAVSARAQPALVTARLLTGTGGLPPPLPLPPPPPDARRELDRIFRRFPHGVVGLWPDLRVAFINARARTLLGREGVVVGGAFPVGPERSELRRHAERLLRLHVPMRPVVLEHEDRWLRVTGIPSHEQEPAVLLLEDMTRERQREQVTSDFLRNASHQLRTPLAAVTAAIDVLQAGAKHDPQARDRFLDHIAAHAGRMTRLTRGLLVLSRAQAGAQPLRLDLVELRPLLDRLTSQLEPPDGVTVETDCPTGLAALGEPDLIEETLWALLDNAVAHTDYGAVRVAAAEVDWQTLIEVSDSGAGILPEHRGRIFEPFYRPWQDGRGFGLGLAIARQAVEAMDGTIEVAGAIGGGTRFVVRLPSARLVG
jgi:PAS domain S-box-containing protein